jgi:hypothetical protein
MRLSSLALAALLATPLAAGANSQLFIVNANGPGVGFNDPTPADPLPTNPGTTVGEQRLIAFQYAADIWGATLDSSVPIFIQASFEPRPCTATSGVLGSAGATFVFSDFAGAIFPATWYASALADKLSGEDLAPGFPDMVARFNSELGKPGCLQTASWYYGRDPNQGPSQINLVTVLLHEFAHGLGFASFTNPATGALLAGQIDVYSKFYWDARDGLFRDQYTTDAERAASALHYRDVAWAGPHATRAAPQVLERGTPALKVDLPSDEVTLPVGPATFGPALSPDGVKGEFALALDPAGTSLACGPVANPAELRRKIAVVDRGACTFVTKVLNAQAAGARAVIVVDNVAGGPPPALGGTDPTVTIPSVRITKEHGDAVKAAMAGSRVEGKAWLDRTRLTGSDRRARVLLNATDPVQPGSSISHWDPLTFRNQLMEPAINADLTHQVTPPEDLTSELLRDLGWFTDRNLDGRPDRPGEVVTRPVGGGRGH